ncbi:MAG: class I SAM-dependent methyltransferase [Gemmatimonadota bacterium]
MIMIESEVDDQRAGGKPACFACGGSDLTPFYEVDGVPVHSCVLIPDEDAARTFRTGSIRLDLCHSCGFIQNSLFDPGSVDYTQEYEEVQGFSPTFRTFAERLVADLDRRHDLHSQPVLEIGCGSKADFLSLLVERTGCFGVGIDPCYRPGKPDSADNGIIEVIADYYSREYAHLTGRLIITRHTLEHIQPVSRFAGSLRASVESTAGAALFIEVPDIARVLRECAFWDIYYEHCSYFSEPSLVRLFAAEGFSVDEVEHEFGGQYLLLHATSDGHGTSVVPGVEDTSAEVGRFVSRFPEVLRRWEDRLRRAADSGRRVVLWGGGSKAVAFLTTIANPEDVAEVVDINPHKQGNFLPVTAHRVVAPEALKKMPPDLVVVMNPIYAKEVALQLDALGVSAEITALE